MKNIFILLIALLLISCDKSEDPKPQSNKFIGKWTGNACKGDYTIEIYNSDGRTFLKNQSTQEIEVYSYGWTTKGNAPLQQASIINDSTLYYSYVTNTTSCSVHLYKK